MNYIEYKIKLNKYLSDDQMGIIISDLGDMGFESFVEEPLELSAYITPNELLVWQEDIASYLESLKPTVKMVEKQEIEQRNWNELWESNFDVTPINDICSVRAPFHEPTNTEFELVIMPKMSFGTGHHETTRLMLLDIFELNVEGKRGLDMGCGTGVLGILAAKRGAKSVDIIDIDRWAFENAIENIDTNGVADVIVPRLGDASLLIDMQFDFILANINRNILLDDMKTYVDNLVDGGTLSISGFLEEDIPMLKACAENLGLVHLKTASFEKWQMMRFEK